MNADIHDLTEPPASTNPRSARTDRALTTQQRLCVDVRTHKYHTTTRHGTHTDRHNGTTTNPPLPHTVNITLAPAIYPALSPSLVPRRPRADLQPTQPTSDIDLTIPPLLAPQHQQRRQLSCITIAYAL